MTIRNEKNERMIKKQCQPAGKNESSKLPHVHLTSLRTVKAKAVANTYVLISLNDNVDL